VSQRFRGPHWVVILRGGQVVLRRWHVHLLVLRFFVLEFSVDGIISVGITGWFVCFGREGGGGACWIVSSGFMV
jgi:hypothetical protein